MFLGSKDRRVCRADNLITIGADCLDNVGSLTSHNPIDLSELRTEAVYNRTRETAVYSQ
jgi:hypothetical protein